MTDPALLEQSVVGAVRARIREKLCSVTYRCLEHEAVESDLADPEFYFGGEVVLTFTGGPLFISWAENVGWTTHFSVATSANSFFLPDARLESFDVSTLPLWHAQVGEALIGVSVLGSDGVPYAVQLAFKPGSLIVASSWEVTLGDGDDVIVREASCLESIPPLEVLWVSGADHGG